MDAKNQQDRAKMVEEAADRMRRLGMMPQVITKFRKQGTVLISETAGILYDLNDEEKKAVADWEEKKRRHRIRCITEQYGIRKMPGVAVCQCGGRRVGVG